MKAVELAQRICERVGIQQRRTNGSLTKKEMIAVLAWIDVMDSKVRQEQQDARPQEA
jgi:hypothetical protein